MPRLDSTLNYDWLKDPGVDEAFAAELGVAVSFRSQFVTSPIAPVVRWTCWAGTEANFCTPSLEAVGYGATRDAAFRDAMEQLAKLEKKGE